MENKKQSLAVQIMKYLTHYPHLRDSVIELSVKYALDNEIKSASEFAGLVLRIDRTSRKLQRDNETLRGKEWQNRQVKAKKVREEIVKPFDFQTEAERVGFVVTKLKSEREQTLLSKFIKLIWS